MARPRHISDDEILEVARECFTADPTTSTVTIAERVGLSQAALFKRFGTKLGLMSQALGVPTTPSWVELAHSGPDDRPVPDQLVELGTRVNAFFTTIMPRVAAMKAAGMTFARMFGHQAEPPPVIGYRALAGWFERAIDQGLVRPADPGGLAIAFIGTFQGRAFWNFFAAGQFPAPLPDNDVYIRHVVDVFWRGLAPEDPEDSP